MASQALRGLRWAGSVPGKGREQENGLSGALETCTGLFNMQRADSQKSMLIFKTLLPRATLPA